METKLSLFADDLIAYVERREPIGNHVEKESPLHSTGNYIQYSVINHNEGDFPGSAVVKTLPSNEVGEGSISGQGTRSHLLQDMAKIKINKFKKNF